MSDLGRAAGRWWNRMNRSGERNGTLGKNVDGTMIYEVGDGRTWVTLDDGTILQVYNDRAYVRVPLPVIVKQVRGVWTVIDIQHDKVMASLGSDAPRTTSGADRSIDGGNPDPVESRRFLPGLLHAYTGLTVYIEPFAYRWNGQDKRWLGGAMNLLTPVDYRPSTAGTHAWVKVGIDPTTNTPVAIEGDEYPLAVTLTSDQLDAIDFATDNYIPAGGVQLRQGQTLSPLERDFMEARQIINAGAGATFDSILTDSDGNVLSDSDGNVLYTG